MVRRAGAANAERQLESLLVFVLEESLLVSLDVHHGHPDLVILRKILLFYWICFYMLSLLEKLVLSRFEISLNKFPDRDVSFHELENFGLLGFGHVLQVMTPGLGLLQLHCQLVSFLNHHLLVLRILFGLEVGN